MTRTGRYGKTPTRGTALLKAAQAHKISREGAESLLRTCGVIRKRKKELDLEQVKRLYVNEKKGVSEVARIMHTSGRRVSIALLMLHVSVNRRRTAA